MDGEALRHEKSKSASNTAITIVTMVGLLVLLLGAAAYVYDAKLNSELEKVKLQRELAAQQAQMKQLETFARLPDLPITATYRRAMMGPGLVIAFSNSSNRALAVGAQFKNPTLNLERSFRVDVPPRGVKEVGHLEGWTFASGDTITITHAEYKPVIITIP